MPMSGAGQAEISLLPGRALEPQTALGWARGLPPVPSSSLISKVYSPPDLYGCRWAQILFRWWTSDRVSATKGLREDVSLTHESKYKGGQKILKFKTEP
ncbi:hypothetical protein QQF64_007211 [Cirrhinus molitorella]|uniref:Uncharacterized protein n=1 Tax=Cirrhinus molitorella TaxID=172907 RepID=A0ABR3MCB4_9TELE